MRVLCRSLAVLGTLLLLLGALSGVVHRQVLDAPRFAEHVDAARADPAVARQLGLIVTDRILDANPDLTALRPLILSVSTSVVADPAAGPAVRFAVAPLFSSLTHGGDDQVLRLADVGTLVVAAVQTLAPQAEVVVPARLDVRLSALGAQEPVVELVQVTRAVGVLSWLLPLLGLLVLGAAGLLSGGGVRRGVRSIGAGLLAAGLGVGAFLVVGRFVVRRADPDTLGGALVRALWRELGGSFWTTAGLLAVAGTLILLAARPGADLDPRTVPDRVWRTLVERGRGVRSELVRGAALLVVGIALVLEPLGTLRLALWLVGLGLVVAGGWALLQAVIDAVRRRRVASEGAGTRVPDAARVVAGVVALVALAVVLVPGALRADDDLTTAYAGDLTACNGSPRLCGKRYDEVAFPATHNSMAAADQPGWFFAEQPDGVISQLDHGVRVFLIDSWYGQRTQRPGVVTNTDETVAAALAELERDVGAPAVQSALRLRDALQLTPRGPVEPYLCHAVCAVGSTRWEPLMEEVRDWLAAHPREVVTFFVQDEVSPADTAKVVQQAGLMPYVHTQRAGEPWPTLGSMIDSGRRLVFLMENRGGGETYPWLLDGFQQAQDTPFLFRRAADFSCAENRGPADAPLFLLNHWITDKRAEVSNATAVNTRSVLLPRAQQCEQERGRLPNYVAVDFYDRGDLFGVVDTLNGLD